MWEANHVWLIFFLVVLWTAFPAVFAAIMSMLYVPLFLAALGIVLRGAGFAFRHVVDAAGHRRAFGAHVRALVAAHAVLHGHRGRRDRVGPGPADGGGDRVTSWLNCDAPWPSALLFVATCAYLAAVFLMSDARRAGEDELVAYFRRRALWAGGRGRGARAGRAGGAA